MDDIDSKIKQMAQLSIDGKLAEFVREKYPEFLLPGDLVDEHGLFLKIVREAKS